MEAGDYNNLACKYIQENNNAKAIDCFKKAIAINPELPDIYNNLGILHVRIGDNAQAIKYYKQALAIKPDCYKTCSNLAKILTEIGEYHEAVAYYQQALQIQPTWQGYYSLARIFQALRQDDKAGENFKLAFSLKPDDPVDNKLIELLQVTEPDGTWPQGYVDYSDKANIITVISAPKSGSSYLSIVLSKLLQLNLFKLCATYNYQEHDLYLPALHQACKMGGCVSLLHMQGSFLNAYYLQQFAIKPIILVRNLFDTIISLKDELKRSFKDPDFADKNFAGFSFIWQNHQHKQLNDKQITDLVIDLCLPWYINFYVSWQDLESNNYCKLFWLTYEELMSNKKAVITRIIDYFELGSNMKISGDKIKVNDDIINSYYPSSNFDHSEARIKPIGIGSKVLSTAQQDRVLQLLSYYPETDFSKVL